MMQKQDKYLKMKKFSFPKLFQIFPKAVRTRTNKGSLTGQVIFKNNLIFLFPIFTILITQAYEKTTIHTTICSSCFVWAG